jgi:hypothetical protein
MLYTLLYMVATRTQIYLSEEQRRSLDEIIAREERSLADVVREAIDTYLARRHPEPNRVFDETFAVCPDLEVPDRIEWERGKPAR